MPVSAWFPQASEFALALSDACGVRAPARRHAARRRRGGRARRRRCIGRAAGQAPAPAPPARRRDTPLLRVRHLSFGYDRKQPILHEYRLDLERGRLVALCGRNGSGKTTLARLIMGINDAPKQSILAGRRKDLSALGPKEISAEVGYVFQNPDHQFVTDRVWDEVAYGLRCAATRRRRRSASGSTRCSASWISPATRPLAVQPEPRRTPAAERRHHAGAGTTAAGAGRADDRPGPRARAAADGADGAAARALRHDRSDDHARCAPRGRMGRSRPGAEPGRLLFDGTPDAMFADRRTADGGRGCWRPPCSRSAVGSPPPIRPGRCGPRSRSRRWWPPSRSRRGWRHEALGRLPVPVRTIVLPPARSDDQARSGWSASRFWPSAPTSPGCRSSLRLVVLFTALALARLSPLRNLARHVAVRPGLHELPGDPDADPAGNACRLPDRSAIPIYAESCDYALASALRIYTIVLSSLVFVRTTDPRELAIALVTQMQMPYRIAYAFFIALQDHPDHRGRDQDDPGRAMRCGAWRAWAGSRAASAR